MSKSLQYIDKMIQLHGGLIGDFDEHGIISGHTVAFNYIGDRLDKWIKFLFLIGFHTQINKCLNSISKGFIINLCMKAF